MRPRQAAALGVEMRRLVPRRLARGGGGALHAAAVAVVEGRPLRVGLRLRLRLVLAGRGRRGRRKGRKGRRAEGRRGR